jgi:NDP-sugar pyrophosphorylase family protein
VKAFVLAGGLGSRLRPRFGDLPKALAPLGGRPFLTHQLEWLARHGVREAVLCVGHGAAELERELGERGDLGVALHYSTEAEPLGTGGALRLAERFVDGPALVLNGDTLVSCDPWALERRRWERGAIGALALYHAADPRSRGRVECDATGRITRFNEKDPEHTGTAWVSGGCYAFSPALWRRLPEGPSSLERDTLPELAAAGHLHGLETPGEFFDIGTPEEWERAERHFAS